MGQVAFDTQEFVETLENAGLPKDQAKAISLVVRKSHEVADLATKRDLDDVRKDLSADIAEVKREIADVRKDLSAEIADVRKDLSAEIADVRKDLSAEISDVRKDMTTQISLVRKDLQLEMAGIRSEQKLIRWMLSAGVLGIFSLVVKAFLVTAL
ncbi:coiled-coil domain-containing protein [Symbiopectobacterium sp. RP]|uniref:coiled-coil domain-containing protein n=1 Tax=Symbiopectobacterium sp. RP TaxID=3248553 RepID=UPI003D27FEFC